MVRLGKRLFAMPKETASSTAIEAGVPSVVQSAAAAMWVQEWGPERWIVHVVGPRGNGKTANPNVGAGVPDTEILSESTIVRVDGRY